MELKKRSCPVKIVLKPAAAYYLSVEMEINGDKHRFLPSRAMGRQFDELMAAAYRLYSENGGMDNHNYAYYWNKSYGTMCTKFSRDGGFALKSIETSVEWDEEGPVSKITLFRDVSHDALTLTSDAPDPVKVTIDYSKNEDKSGVYTYTVDGRDLCYAIAKAATDVLKKYGFHGYYYSTGEDTVEPDMIDVDQLLFFKAYALGAMEVRDFSKISLGGATAFATDFENEMELLAFDM